MTNNNIWVKVLATMAWVSTSIATNLISSEPAQAQFREPRNSRLVICESWDRDYTECQIDTRRGVRIVRQLSNASCRGNWGYGRGYIWVDNGCRAEFAVGSRYSRPNRPNDWGRQLVRCESWDERFQRCPINTRRAREVRLVRQLSNRSCRGNWGYGIDHVWVDNGCRAEFESYR